MKSETGLTVSVITPCYNGARFLAETLQSALAQTQPPHEIIVVDDGSTDDSAAIAESFGPPVRVIRQSNRGESVARNRGLAEATGDYILFLDADDLISRDALERLSKAAGSAPNAVALCGYAEFESDPSHPLRVQVPAKAGLFPRVIRSSIAPPHCFLTPRETVRAAGGFNESIRHGEDWEFWFRIALQNPPLVTVRQVAAYYRKHPNSQCASAWSNIDRQREFLQVMEFVCRSLLDRPDLLGRWGRSLFWRAIDQVRVARAAGIPWIELQNLARLIEQVVHRHRRELRDARVARMVALLGVRWTETLRGLLVANPHRQRFATRDVEGARDDSSSDEREGSGVPVALSSTE